MNENAKRKPTKPQSDNNGSDRRGTRRPPGRYKEAFQWGDITADRIGELVQVVTRAGNAIICGVTSDGGALSITILDGEDRIREWPATLEQFEGLLEWIHSTYAAS